ncbi:MAG: hypothetical protein U0704_15890 [Candidatus Eisenbacteria bacterium]
MRRARARGEREQQRRGGECRRDREHEVRAARDRAPGAAAVASSGPTPWANTVPRTEARGDEPEIPRQLHQPRAGAAVRGRDAAESSDVLFAVWNSA